MANWEPAENFKQPARFAHSLDIGSIIAKPVPWVSKSDK